MRPPPCQRCGGTLIPSEDGVKCVQCRGILYATTTLPELPKGFCDDCGREVVYFQKSGQASPRCQPCRAARRKVTKAAYARYLRAR